MFPGQYTASRVIYIIKVYQGTVGSDKKRQGEDSETICLCVFPGQYTAPSSWGLDAGTRGLSYI